MKHLDLFSGVAGFSIGLERAGFKTVAFAENEPFCQKVLNKNYPDVPIYEDVKNVTRKRLEADGIIGIRLITGGFPCQPHSYSGDRKASEDSRDLWPETFRIISESDGAWFIGENVLGLLSSEDGRFFGGILRDLASIGYNVEWFNLPAGAVGAPHLRPRVWLVAYPDKTQLEGRSVSSRIHEEYANTSYTRWGQDKPGVDRTLNGISRQMDRVGALGNAIVPQIPELIGKAILEITQYTQKPEGMKLEVMK